MVRSGPGILTGTVPSSSGPGHHPLKVETRVRTPLGLPGKRGRDRSSSSIYPMVHPTICSRGDSVSLLEEIEDAVAGREGVRRIACGV